MKPILSMIIINYKSWSFVERNLETLLPSLKLASEPEAQSIEIIVIDNHSNDNYLSTFKSRYPTIKVALSKGNFGYAHACNQGASLANGPWLLFMNPDIVCDWANLKHLLDTAVNSNHWSILTGTQRDSNGKMQRAFGSFGSPLIHFPIGRALLRTLNPKSFPNPRKLPARPETISVGWVSGSLLLIERQAFEQLKGWDEDFWLYHEDTDLCYRAIKHGLNVGFEPKAQFIHSHASSTRSDSDTTALTKSEALISYYLFLHKHYQGKTQRALMVLFRYQQAFSRRLWEMINFLSASRIGRVKLRIRISERIKSYLIQTRDSGTFISDRSINHPNQKTTRLPQSGFIDGKSNF